MAHFAGILILVATTAIVAIIGVTQYKAAKRVAERQHNLATRGLTVAVTGFSAGYTTRTLRTRSGRPITSEVLVEYYFSTPDGVDYSGTATLPSYPEAERTFEVRYDPVDPSNNQLIGDSSPVSESRWYMLMATLAVALTIAAIRLAVSFASKVGG